MISLNVLKSPLPHTHAHTHRKTLTQLAHPTTFHTPGKAPPAYNYLPFFYSRVFNLSWQFYGLASPTAAVTPFGVEAALAAAESAAAAKFGAYWVDGGKVVGVFIEGGSPEECAAAKAVAAAAPPAPAAGELAAAGAEFLTAAAAKL